MLDRLAAVLTRIDLFFSRMYQVMMWKNLFLICAGLFLLYNLAYSTLFDLVLLKDAFYYTCKGMEIAQGDLSLYQPQAIGWPLFLSVFYRLFGTETIFEAMFISRWLSIILICLAVIPIKVLCRKMCPDNRWQGAAILAITAYVLSPLINSIARTGYTESLFILLTLWCYCYLVNKEETTLRQIALASLIAGLSYWVRANGLFQLIVILCLVVLWSAGSLRNIFSRGATAVFVFGVVTAPKLLMRYHQFGSAFDYGPNSKYFVENFSQVWDDTVPVPTLIDYLTSHGWHDYYHKFIEFGLFRVLKTLPTMFSTSIWIWLLVLFIVLALFRRERIMYPFVLLFILTTMAFSLVFHVFGHVRHLIFFVPFIFISCSVLLTRLSRCRFPVGELVISVLLVYTLVLYPGTELLSQNHIKIPELKDTWAIWTADNLEGNVALVSGGDILSMGQHYRFPAAELVPMPFAEVQEKITRVRVRKYHSVDEMLQDFSHKQVSYLIIDRFNLYRRPFLKKIRDEKWHDVFEELNYFANGNRGAVMFGVHIYRIHYDKWSR